MAFLATALSTQERDEAPIGSSIIPHVPALRQVGGILNIGDGNDKQLAATQPKKLAALVCCIEGARQEKLLQSMRACSIVITRQGQSAATTSGSL